MSRTLLLGLLLLCLASHAARAAPLSWCAVDDPARLANPATASAPCPVPDDPQTLPDRLALPLPCFGYLLMSKVVVSATDVLEDQKVHLGSPPPEPGTPALPALIEGPQVVTLAGGFNHGEGPRNPTQSVEFSKLTGRSYYIAVYPLTQPQMRRIKLVGDGGADPSGPDCRAVTDAVTSAPNGDVRAVTGLSWFDANDAVRRYQNWLLARDRPLIAAHRTPSLPWEQGSAAYLRLPTEAEWEFAARGGVADQQDQGQRFYKVSSPGTAVPRTPSIEEITSLRDGSDPDDRGSPRLGQKLPNRLGLHDLLGNVEQITLEPFRLTRPDELQGQAGGYVVRGGHYLTSPAAIGLGHRREVPYFDLNGETRGATVGVRFALSVPVFVGGVSPNPNERYEPNRPNQKLVEALSAARLKLVAAKDTDRGQADTGLAVLIEHSDTLDRDKLRTDLDMIKANLDRSNAQLAATDEIARREALEGAVLLAANLRALRHSSDTNRALTDMLAEEAKSCLRPDSLARQLQRLDRVRDRISELESAVQPTYNYYLSRLQDLARLPAEQRVATADAVQRAFRGRSLGQYDAFQRIVVRQTDVLATTGNAVSDTLRRAWSDELYNALLTSPAPGPKR